MTAKSLTDKPFDVIGKRLIAAHPEDWLVLIGVTDTGAVPVEVVDGDLATLVPQADRVLLKGGDVPELFNLELETGHHGNKLPERLLLYSVTLTQKYAMPVCSAVFLLRKEADSPLLTGVHEKRYVDGTTYLRFDYRVIRVWQLSAETLLAGGVATLPLAPIADVPESDLPRIIERMRERIEAEPKDAQGELWASTYFLMGARFSDTVTDQLLKGIGTMFESSTYNAAVEKGRVQGVAQGLTQGVAQGLTQGVVQGLTQGELRGRLREGRELIMALGRERLGEPLPEIVMQLEGVSAPELFPALIKRVAVAKSWNDLFAV